VFVDFPLEQMHPNARKAAEAAHCAGDQGKFWQMHDRLFAQSPDLDLKQYPANARQLGLDVAAFDACLRSGSQSSKIDRALASGRSIGINATPSFVIARTEAGGSVSGTLITGAQPLVQYQQAIERALAVK
jgi:protein-disulfide isomerase